MELMEARARPPRRRNRSSKVINRPELGGTVPNFEPDRRIFLNFHT